MFLIQQFCILPNFLPFLHTIYCRLLLMSFYLDHSYLKFQCDVNGEVAFFVGQRQEKLII